MVVIVYIEMYPINIGSGEEEKQSEIVESTIAILLTGNLEKDTLPHTVQKILP